MRAIRDTYRESHGGKPVISIIDQGDCVIGRLDDLPPGGKHADRIVAYRYGDHAVSTMRKYLLAEWSDHTIRG